MPPFGYTHLSTWTKGPCLGSASLLSHYILSYLLSLLLPNVHICCLPFLTSLDLPASSRKTSSVPPPQKDLSEANGTQHSAFLNLPVAPNPQRRSSLKLGIQGPPGLAPPLSPLIHHTPYRPPSTLPRLQACSLSPKHTSGSFMQPSPISCLPPL